MSGNGLGGGERPVEARTISSETAQFGTDPGEESRPSREAAEAAVRVLIRWAGDDPGREGLRDTPARVIRAYEEWFGGYDEDAEAMLDRTFSEIGGYREMVLLKDIRFVSHCEHHLAPIVGRAHIAYVPRDRVVGISKLARLVDVFARRLQIQERLTAEIAEALDAALQPLGVAVMIEASHGCMTTRGVQKEDTLLVTTRMLGLFQDQVDRRTEFRSAIANRARRCP
jgi:GTP cyclohydrolase I